MSTLTYIFSGGRQEKLSKTNLMATDFFYGYLELKKEDQLIKFIELKNTDTGYFDKLILRIFKLPIYFKKFLSFENYKILKSSKYIVCINETSFLTSLPFLIYLKLFYKKKVFFFPMGLVDKFLKGNLLSKSLINISLRFADRVLFIGKGEMLAATKNISKHNRKFEYIPFSIDTNFWTGEGNSSKDIKNILFVGNDKNRDYSFLKSFIKNNQEYIFTVITNNSNFTANQYENLILLKGEWRASFLSDKDILAEYRKADLVVLPLNNTTQPSGQSVALQAMSTNTPVMITKTDGFWDEEIFIDKENIIFMPKNDLREWSNAIKYYSENISKLNLIGNKGKQTVEKFFNIEKFSNHLKSIIISY